MDVVLALVAIQQAVVQLEAQVVSRGGTVGAEVVALAGEINAVQTGQEERTRTPAIVAHTGQGLGK